MGFICCFLLFTLLFLHTCLFYRICTLFIFSYFHLFSLHFVLFAFCFILVSFYSTSTSLTESLTCISSAILCCFQQLHVCGPACKTRDFDFHTRLAWKRGKKLHKSHKASFSRSKLSSNFQSFKLYLSSVVCENPLYRLLAQPLAPP